MTNKETSPEQNATEYKCRVHFSDSEWKAMHVDEKVSSERFYANKETAAELTSLKAENERYRKALGSILIHTRDETTYQIVKTALTI